MCCKEVYEKWYRNSNFTQAINSKAFVQLCEKKHRADTSRYMKDLAHRRKDKRAAIVHHIAKHNKNWRWPGYPVNPGPDNEPQYFLDRIKEVHKRLKTEGKLMPVAALEVVPDLPGSRKVITLFYN